VWQDSQRIKNKALAGVGETRYYFSVDDTYCWKKLRMLLCPYVHRGAWARTGSQVESGFAYHPPRNDIHAPDLYLPLMGMLSYAACRAATSSDGPSPSAVHGALSRAILAWLIKAAILIGCARSRGLSSTPSLEIIAHAGYPLIHSAMSVLLLAFSGRLGLAVSVYLALSAAAFSGKSCLRILREAGARRSGFLLSAVAVLELLFVLWLGRPPAP